MAAWIWICFATFIYMKIVKVPINEQQLKPEKNFHEFGILRILEK
jgi:hypothetical protein